MSGPSFELGLDTPIETAEPSIELPWGREKNSDPSHLEALPSEMEENMADCQDCLSSDVEIIDELPNTGPLEEDLDFPEIIEASVAAIGNSSARQDIGTEEAEAGESFPIN